MKHKYTIDGMTCLGCQSSVEDALSEIKEVIRVSTDLKESEVTIEMNSHVPLQKLQQTLTDFGLHYTIHEGNVKSHAKTQHKAGSHHHNSSGVYYSQCIVKETKLIQSRGIARYAAWICLSNPHLLPAKANILAPCTLKSFRISPAHAQSAGWI